MLACLRGEGDALSHVGVMRTRQFHQVFNGLARHAARISTRQPYAAPEIGVTRLGKPGDRRGDPRRLGPLDEPEAPAQPLVEDPASVAREPLGNPLAIHRLRPVEVTLMEPMTINGQPSQQGVELRESAIDPSAKLRQRPAGSHLDHVDVGRPWTSQELLQPVTSPGREHVEQV